MTARRARLLRVSEFALTCAMVLLAPIAHAQGHLDVIVGHVSDDSGHAIPHAQIAVTRAPDRRSLFAETGPDGNYELSFPDGTGDYLVHIAAPGMNEFRKRITRAGAETTFVVDAKLQSTVATLEAVRVKARAIARLERGDTFGSEFAETPALGSFQASLTPSQAGDLDAAAATQPGIRALPGGGISAHGLSADQSTATLNGMAFDASFLPRDVGAEVRVGSSPYDASIGGYSGTEVAARINPGTWLTQKTAHITLDAPPMQLGLQSPAGNSPRFTSIDAGFGRTGEIVERVWNYRAAAQGVYRTTPIMPFGDGAGGLSPDARATVNSALSQIGVRTRETSGLDRAQLGRGSVVLQFDRTPSQRVSLSEIFYAGVTSATGAGVNALASTASAISDHGMNAFNEFQRSEYFADRRGLNETRLAMNFMSHTRDASRTLPSGTVLVQSGQSDTARNFVPVSFGGPRGPLGSSNLASVVLRNETTRMSMSGIHHLKLAAEAGFERANLRDETNSLGAYSYSSLDDLVAGAPAQFIRAIGDRSLSGQLWRGFVSLGDFWRASDDLQLMYGARFEADRLTNGAAVDDDVARDFGIADGTSHDQVAISPRLGFRWVYRKATAKDFKPYKKDSFGYFDNSGPSFVVRGGIGAFRNTPTASVLSNAVIRAGMPLGGQRLICLGSAVPSADWTAFAADRNSIPSACTAGSAVTMANVAPGASFIDSRYSSPTSWRGNLSVVTELWNWRATVDGTVSLNRNQQSTRDLNFANVVQFRTTDEQRPVFTPINDIVASTGAVSPIGARTDARFGRVLAIGSDARSIDNEVTIKLVPDYGVLGDGWLSLAYTLSSSRMRANGFDVPTFGSPVALQSGRNDFVPRHQFSVQAGYRFAQGLSASIFGNFWSGLPFTPMVGADVNGDGLANDRAFVFSPSAASDSAIANGMAALLSNGRGNGARCLASQLGRVASRASCAGPWTGMLNLRVDVAGEKLGLGKRTRMALSFNNTLGALDQLLHGQNRTHRWGVNVAPDPVLYEVRGFDPSAMRFRYAVNSHFGRPLGNAIASPFGITLDLSIDLSEPNDLQQVKRTVNSGRPGHTGVRMSADSIRTRYSHVVLDPYAYLVFYSDSLLLTKAQLRAIRAADSVYRARLDSVWRPLGEYLYALPDGFDAATVMKTTNDAVDRAWALTKLEEPKIRAILSPLQWQLLPSGVRSILDPKYKPHFVLPS